MASTGPFAEFQDADGNVVPCLASLLKHAALHNERAAERSGTPPMPLHISEPAPGVFCLGFGPVGMQGRDHWETWKTINALAVAWEVGYQTGVLSA